MVFRRRTCFDQPEFEALLRSNLKRYPQAALRGNSEVTEIAEDGRGHVLVTYVDRVSGVEEVVEAEYVLGCDGANSVGRSAIGASMEDMKFQQRWLVVDVATAADLDQWEGVHQVCDPARAATFMRIGEMRYRWEFRLLDGEKAADYQTISDLRPLIGPWVTGTTDDELELVRVAEYTFRAQLADRWRRGNVFILGDAAHLTPPFIGQGMGAGVRDAMNLAWKLAGVLTGDLPAATLDSYEQERKPHVRYMIRFALAMGWAMTAGGDFGNFVRRTVVPRLKVIPGMRAKVCNSATPPLHRSPFVDKSRAPRQLAGSLSPNPVVALGRRLDEVVGNRFALVTCHPLDDGQRAEVERGGGVVVAAEPGNELARWLRRGRATAAVVRPDRTVMRADRRLATVCDALPVMDH
jgi:3-(3-hydroxy-phenyl)propionate hydroxylase